MAGVGARGAVAGNGRLGLRGLARGLREPDFRALYGRNGGFRRL